MGLDVDTYLVIGAAVQDTEIFAYSEHVPFNCASCLKSHVDGLKYCGECGRKLNPVRRANWAPLVLSFLKSQNRCLDLDERGPSIHGSGPFFDVRAMQSSEDQERPVLAVGIKFEGQSLKHSHQAGPIEWEGLERARIEVEFMIQRLGLSPREIKLYPVMYVSC